MYKLVGLVGVVLFGVSAPLAQAAIEIAYKLDGAASVVCANGASGPIFCSAVVGDVSIGLISANSNSPGTSASAFEVGGQFFIQNTSATTPHTLEVWIASQFFTAPTTPPAINFSSRLTTNPSLPTSSGSSALDSCVDLANGLTDPTGAGFCQGVGSPTLTNPSTPYAGFTTDSTVVGLIPTLTTTPYSIGQHITLLLNPGAIVSLNSSTSLTPVPEPMSIALLGGAILLISRKLRQKRDQSAKV